MARFFTGLFGSSTKQTQAPATSLRVNTSLQGVAIPLLLGGAQRMSGNLIDYYGFASQQQSGQSSGKGGITGGGTKGASGGSYVYSATFAVSICEGPIATIDAMWVNGSAVGLGANNFQQVTLPDGSVVDYEAFTGGYTQTVWGFTESEIVAGQLAATHGLFYRGTAYVAFANYPLGGSTSLPNLTFEAVSSNSGLVPGQADGFPDLAWSAFLSNAFWGIGFPAFRMGDLSIWRNYTVALGLGVSPAIASPVQASAFCNDLLTATNSSACWQDGALTVVPYGDAAVTTGAIQTASETHTVPNTAYPVLTVSNFATFAGDSGVTYQGGAAFTQVASYTPPLAAGTYFRSGGSYYFSLSDVNSTIVIAYEWAATASYLPDTTPLYDFTLDDFLAQQGTIGSGLAASNSPLSIVRKPRDLMLNNVKLEYLDRTNNYNPVVIEAKDEAAIIAFGRERPSNIRQLHLFCLAAAAQQSAQLQLIREQVARTYQWTCGRHFSLILQLMKLVTVSDPGQNIVRQPVRITEIQENSDFSLTVTAEEYLGTVSAPQYGSQASSGFVINYNIDPGSINPPIIFEPSDELGGGLVVQAAVSGSNIATWGGCHVWASYDGENYTRLPGTQFGAARMGVLTSVLPAVTANPTGGTSLDTSNVLSVDLSESGGSLSSATQQDALALNTRCYVGGEIIAFATAQLTAKSKYNLSYLVRGAYGTETAIASHPAGARFARLDDAILSIPFDQSRIGAVVYLKFQSFNIYEGGLQNLANCPVYPYTLTGAALASPLPSITNLRTVFDLQAGFTELNWDDIKDFRAFKYEIRSGTSFASAVSLGQVAHPPFRVPGNGTYWIAAVAQPAPGLNVTSETWQSIQVAGAIITQNVMLSIDLKALNWPGTFTGGAGVDSALNAIRSGGSNILTDASILATPDILNYGGGSSGTYFAGNAAFLDIGYVANASVSIQYQPTGVPVGQNILAIGNILATPDILGSASSQFVSVYPLINTATAVGGDLYAIGDLYQYPDLYSAGDYNWVGFQRFSPGTYQARVLAFAVFLETADPLTIAYNLALVIIITIPARIDTYAATTSAAADITINFQPTGAAAAAFNGGAGPGDLPAISWGIINAQAGDDLIITALSLASISFKILNGGSRVVRNLNLFAEGF